jgi:hypothetical protein
MSSRRSSTCYAKVTGVQEIVNVIDLVEKSGQERVPRQLQSVEST